MFDLKPQMFEAKSGLWSRTQAECKKGLDVIEGHPYLLSIRYLFGIIKAISTYLIPVNF
jgi:hypothetical protein